MSSEVGVLDSELSAWIDRSVAYIVANHEVVAGPSGQVVLGRRHNGIVVEWQRADTMSEAVFGDTSVSIPDDLITPFFERLTAHAHRHVQLVGVYDSSTPGHRAYLGEGNYWYLQGVDEDDENICHNSQGVICRLPQTHHMGDLTILDANASSKGDMLRVVAVLSNGDPAYVIGNLELLVPCPSGEARDIIFVVECQVPDEEFYGYRTYGVSVANLGLGASRPGAYRGTRRQGYYAYPVVFPDDTVQWGVLQL